MNENFKGRRLKDLVLFLGVILHVTHPKIEWNAAFSAEHLVSLSLEPQSEGI
jgi:hypothetical protein